MEEKKERRKTIQYTFYFVTFMHNPLKTFIYEWCLGNVNPLKNIDFYDFNESEIWGKRRI